MQKKNDALRNASPLDIKSLHPFSNFRELSESEWLAIRLAVTTNTRIREPKSVRTARSRIESAEFARDHLLSNGLIPIFDSFEFEAMLLKETFNVRKI